MEELVYAYVACMAVRRQERRKGIASALLKAAEIQARFAPLLCVFKTSSARQHPCQSGLGAGIQLLKRGCRLGSGSRTGCCSMCTAAI